MTAPDATVVCVLTPAGRGAVAVVGIEGSAAASAAGGFFCAANRRPLDEQPLNRIVYGRWASAESAVDDCEDLVVCRRSGTRVEIHCHGGTQSSAQIVADLIAAGCKEIDRLEWLRLEIDCPIRAAAQLALAQATTVRTASILLDQYDGALRRAIESIIADLEANRVEEARSRVQELLEFADFGLHLTRPWQVAIAGQPNVGKSSLINALVGFQRAIVFDQPGTTRDVVTATTAIDGWPVQLSDTAGLHDTADTIESAGIELARQRLAAADLIVWVLDARDVAADEPNAAWELAIRQSSEVGLPLAKERVLLVANKYDLSELQADEDLSLVATCALTGLGIKSLIRSVSMRLVPEAPAAGSPVLFAREQTDLLEKSVSAPAEELALQERLRMLIESK